MLPICFRLVRSVSDLKNTYGGIIVLGIISSLLATYIWTRMHDRPTAQQLTIPAQEPQQQQNPRTDTGPLRNNKPVRNTRPTSPANPQSNGNGASEVVSRNYRLTPTRPIEPEATEYDLSIQQCIRQSEDVHCWGYVKNLTDGTIKLRMNHTYSTFIDDEGNAGEICRDGRDGAPHPRHSYSLRVPVSRLTP